MHMKQGILVPFDGSANAVEAVRVAIEMAKVFKEKITLLNVQHSYETLHTKMFFDKVQIHDYQLQQAEEIMRPALDVLKQSGVDFSSKMRVGDPRDQIIREAQSDCEQGKACMLQGMRWIVMGSRGLNAFLGSVIGSVSMGVLHGAPCPVVIVPYSCQT